MSNESAERSRRNRGPQKQKGAVTLRGDAARADEGATSDQRLLDSVERADWLHSDPWRVLRIQAEVVEGFEALAELPPAVAVFGSARTQEENVHYQRGRELGAALAREGWPVITGGGPGIMEAANRGAYEEGGTSVGLGIELPFEQHLNEWVDLGIEYRYFFLRKVGFMKASFGFCVLPGGFGTLDELFEALTLVQTRKVNQFPVVLLGTEYWGPMVEWLKDTMLVDGYISPVDLELFTVTDSVDEVIEILREADRARKEGRLGKRPLPGPPIEA